MRIERYQRRRSTWSPGCVGILALGLALGVGGLIALIASGGLVPVVLAITGVERVGSTDDLFAEAENPVGVPVVVNEEQAPRQYNVTLGSYGRETVYVDGADYDLTTGTNGNGRRVARASFSEGALLDLCAARTSICREGDNRLRNVQIDIRPGGAVIYADANAGVFWQRIGVVLQIDPVTGRTFRIAGVDVEGITYNPETLPFGLSESIGGLLRDIEREGNAILRQMSLSVNGDGLSLVQIEANDDALTITMQ